jgi:hypothetical protein
MRHACLPWARALRAMLFSGNQLANMEAVQKDLRDHEGTFHNRDRKKFCGGPYCLDTNVLVYTRDGFEVTLGFILWRTWE